MGLLAPIGNDRRSFVAALPFNFVATAPHINVWGDSGAVHGREIPLSLSPFSLLFLFKNSAPAGQPHKMAAAFTSAQNFTSPTPAKASHVVHHDDAQAAALPHLHLHHLPQ